MGILRNQKLEVADSKFRELAKEYRRLQQENQELKDYSSNLQKENRDLIVKLAKKNKS